MSEPSRLDETFSIMMRREETGQAPFYREIATEVEVPKVPVLLALVVVALGTAFASATGALAYDTVGTASAPTAVVVSTPHDTLLASSSAHTTTGGPGAVPAQDGCDDCDRWWNDGWDMHGWWIVMPVMMVLFWGGIIVVTIWGTRRFTRGRFRAQKPLYIAKKRLARGEITKEEFDRIRGDLE